MPSRLSLRPGSSRRAAPSRARKVQLSSTRVRARTLYLAALFIFTVFAAQLVRVQAFDAADNQRAALTKRLNTTVVPAVRGRILDSKGTVFASSVERRTVTVNQNAVKSYQRTVDKQIVTVGVVGAAQRLAPLLESTPEALLPQLMGTSSYRVLSKNVSPAVWRQIEAIGIPGIASEVTFQREYPAGGVAAPVVGFVNAGGNDATITGGAGVEQMQEAALAGTPGHSAYEQARDGSEIPWARLSNVAAVDGSDVHLTIDADLQWYAQNAIAEQVSKTGSISGAILVMEAKTGKLRAVASSPTFDPANLAKATPSQLRSSALQDVYEPGSTAKVLSIAAALEEKAITPSTGVIVPNRLRRGDTTYKDYTDHATLDLTVAGILAKSSNIGTILATESVPASKIEQYYRAFGLGAKPGTGFPGEPAGLITPAGELSGSQRFTQLYGQGVSVSTLQMVSVYQTIANGGVRIAPRLIDSIDGPDGPTTPPTPEPTRVVSEQTAHDLGAMLEGVIGPGGTGSKISVPGYRVAGKSGTAYRYEDALRDYSGYTLSFIGYAPADNPQFVVAVILQKPALTNPSSSGLCGPVFANVMNYALQAYRVPPTGTPSPGLPLTISTLPGGEAPVVIRDSRTNG